MATDSNVRYWFYSQTPTQKVQMVQTLQQCWTNKVSIVILCKHYLMVMYSMEPNAKQIICWLVIVLDYQHPTYWLLACLGFHPGPLIRRHKISHSPLPQEVRVWWIWEGVLLASRILQNWQRYHNRICCQLYSLCTDPNAHCPIMCNWGRVCNYGESGILLDY